MSDEHNEKLKKARDASEKMAQRKLNLHSPELQGNLSDWVESYLQQKTHYQPGSYERVDYPRFGMLAEILSRTPARIYDLPELKAHCDTAFVDTTGRLYISDTFFRILEQEQLEGKQSLYFIFSHEMEHNRRMHLQRMLDYPSDISNIAQDIRINCDVIQLLAWDSFIEKNHKTPSDTDLKSEIQFIYSMLGPAIRSGWATSNYSDYEKWSNRSEESIAAELYKNQKDKKNDPENNIEMSFISLCEGAAQDFNSMSAIAIKSSNHKNASDYLNAEKLCRTIGKSKGKTTILDLNNLLAHLDVAINSVEITARNLEHESIKNNAALLNIPVQSVTSGDAYVDSLVPLERLSALSQVLRMILNPTNSSSQEQNQNGKIKIKDLDLPRSNPKAAPQGNKSEQTPSLNDSDNHTMSAEKLAKILKDAGVHDAVKALGYDDLEKIESETVAAKNNVSSAINKSTETERQIGGVFPGQHLTSYAVLMLNDFFKPVLSWKITAKQMIEETGKKTRFEHDEPWTQYFSSAQDQGLESEDDIGYMGSYIAGGTSRPLVVNIIDSSGSVTDRMLKGFVSESINVARDMGNGESSAEVIIIFADTIARGEPILINEDNVDQYLKSGIGCAGRGGTNFTASVQNTFRMLTVDNGEDSALAHLRGRKIDAMIYFTDTFDAPPEQSVIEETASECGMSKLPTMLFLAPKECYSDSFKEGVKAYAECIFFDTDELLLDFDCIEKEIENRGMRAVLS